MSNLTKAIRFFIRLFQFLRDRGLSDFLIEIRRLVWSERKKWLLMRAWDAHHDIQPQEDGAMILRESSLNDLESIFLAWPTDFIWLSNPSRMRLAIRKNFEVGWKGFVACEGDEVIGAIWCKPWEYDDLLPERRRGKPAYEICHLFTAERARGKEIAGKLIDFSMESMAQEGKTTGYSLIRPDRTASLVAHEKAGFEKMGWLVIRCRFGRGYRWLEKAPEFSEDET